MKRILITGGTGFVGSYLIKELLNQNEDIEVHITSFSGTGNKNSDVIIHKIDLSNASDTEKLIKELKPDEIYHLASLASVELSFEKPRVVLEQNFSLTLNVLEAVRLHCPDCKILLISSADIYKKDQVENHITEQTPMETTNPYGASKAIQDILGQTYVKTFGLKVIIARPFNHIGAGQQTGFVVANFAKQIAEVENEIDENKRIVKVGNLDAKRDFTAVEDMVKAYTLLMTKGKIGEIYNIGSNRPLTIREILDELVGLAKVPIAVEIDPNKLRPVDYLLISGDNSKIVALGWQPTADIKKNLPNILDYWRKRVLK
ncbi:MAG: GDP-mannose 4,6-dehydratase [Pseudomonadales bacterium]|jgi:GDP-4-dehydro-6-deoxy-D-mannose reductase|nr:GDP-mannose 4,6-dehydratase [Pseudomonadales bacterium]